jgi:predicted nucleic acid-binding protein
MIIVADSSPFVVLVAVEHIDLLAAVFREVTIPPQVQTELTSSKRSDAVRAFIAAPPSWLHVVFPSSIEPIQGRHAGESAAISLAQELRADRIVIDESLGRRAAAERGLRVIGTIGILESAAERDLIDSGYAFAKVKKTDFWVSPAFLDERLALFLARKHPENT